MRYYITSNNNEDHTPIYKKQNIQLCSRELTSTGCPIQFWHFVCVLLPKTCRKNKDKFWYNRRVWGQILNGTFVNTHLVNGQFINATIDQRKKSSIRRFTNRTIRQRKHSSLRLFTNWKFCQLSINKNIRKMGYARNLNLQYQKISVSRLILKTKVPNKYYFQKNVKCMCSF